MRNGFCRRSARPTRNTFIPQQHLQGLEMATSDALDDLLIRAAELRLVNEADIDQLTDQIARRQCTEQDMLLCWEKLVWRAEHPSELPLDDDSMAQLAERVALDARFPFSLVCKQFNAARTMLHDSSLCTIVQSSMASVTVREWALSVGCPPEAGFPCWAEAHSLKSAPELNGRTCRILGPPDSESGRCPVEFDNGWGSVEACIVPKRVENGGEIPLADLWEAARKSVRHANLRLLDDNELLRAVRIMCRAEVWAARRAVPPFCDTSKLHQTQSPVDRYKDDVGLLPIYLPKRHSAVMFMRAWELRGQEHQKQMERCCNNGQRNPFSPRQCGTPSFYQALEDIGGYNLEGLSGKKSPGSEHSVLHYSSTFMSPLMSLVGKSIFIQPVALERLLDTTREALIRTSALDNVCVAQLMAAPDNDVMDSPVWFRGPGSVVAFMTQQDLTARDIELAWRFALKVDPGDYDSKADFLANFTAEKYDKHVRICNARDDMMSRVHVSDDGARIAVNTEGW